MGIPCSECYKAEADAVYKWSSVNLISFVCKDCVMKCREDDAEMADLRSITGGVA